MLIRTHADAHKSPQYDAQLVAAGVTEEYPCGCCMKRVSDDDDAVCCDTGCGLWFHRQCVCMSERAFEKLNSEESVDWLCDFCESFRKGVLTDAMSA